MVRGDGDLSAAVSLCLDGVKLNGLGMDLIGGEECYLVMVVDASM